MDIKRCTTSFAAGAVGAGEGDLFPAVHPLVKAFPGLFEDVSDYVARRFPEYAPKPAADHTEAPAAKAEDTSPKPAAKKTAPRKPAARRSA